MALESCEGGELFDRITTKGRLSETEARFYAAEVVDTLEYIHGMGLIHRDIKPENLLLTAEGHIKIADFGSVKPMEDTKITILPNAAADDKACTFVGTATYVPPEVLNSSPATVGNDLWALGCTLYQMISGTSPFKDASEWLIFQKIMARDINFPTYFSDEARDLIERLLSTDPCNGPGAGPEGYAALKKHPFFKGVEWSTLREQTPPKLANEATAQTSGSEYSQETCSPAHIGDGSVNGNRDNSGASPSSAHVTRQASIESFDSKCHFIDSTYLRCIGNLLKGVAIHGPVFVSFSLAVTIMADKVPSFKNGGAFLFTDLATPDYTLIFPSLTLLSSLACFRSFWREKLTRSDYFALHKDTRFAFYWKWTFGAAATYSVMLLPFSILLPQAVYCYMLTSNVFSLCVNSYLNDPDVRKALGFPELPVPTPSIFSSDIGKDNWPYFQKR